MKIIPFLVGPCLLTLLVGCNDVSSNHKLGSEPVVATPGVEGTNTRDDLLSSIHREKGSPVLTYADEITATLNSTLSQTIYRSIPMMAKDDEGSSLSVITITNIGRPKTVCGIGDFAGIDARVSDCLSKNNDSALWDANRYGSSGEGNWNLVTRNADGKEIWLDTRSGMVWSDPVTDTGVNVFNWCKASGNTEGNTTTETINCTTVGENKSLCENTTFADVGTQVTWRLPTRNDYLQADLNGLRFVLSKETNTGAWTATMRAASVGRTEAWVYNSAEGTLSSGTLTTERQVRCVGAPAR
jgi:hypothetical protein